jgi:biopolymer transport protein ExbD
MSAEVQESGKKKGNSKQKKMTVRVDFTPMVDMNMLLITFFIVTYTYICFSTRSSKAHASPSTQSGMLPYRYLRIP